MTEQLDLEDYIVEQGGFAGSTLKGRLKIFYSLMQFDRWDCDEMRENLKRTGLKIVIDKP